MGSASLNSVDGTLLCSASAKSRSRVFWLGNGVITKQIPNADYGLFSPDGALYFYTKGGTLFICTTTNQVVRSFELRSALESLVWSGDSRSLIMCAGEYSKGSLPNYVVSRYEIATGKTSILLRTVDCFRPVTTNDADLIYLLRKQRPELADGPCDIVRYSISTKSLTKVDLPEGRYFLFDSLTVSPNGRIVMFDGGGALFVIDLHMNKIIDCVDLREHPFAADFTWSSDSSYVIFALMQRQLVKYVVPKDESGQPEE